MIRNITHDDNKGESGIHDIFLYSAMREQPTLWLLETFAP